MTRIVRVADRRALDRSVEDYLVRGYEIREQGDTSTLMKERDWGDAPVHILLVVLTVWWTFGLANALYAIYRRVTADEVEIRVEDGGDDPPATPDADPANESARERRPARDSPDPTGHRDPRSAPDRPDPTDHQGPRSAPDPTGHQHTRPSHDHPDPGPRQDPQPTPNRPGHTTRQEPPTEARHAGTGSTTATWAVLQVYSLLVAGLVLLAIAAVQTGQLGLDAILPTLGTLAAAVVFRYVAVYHRFTDPRYRTVLLVPSAVATAVATALTAKRFVDAGTLDALARTVQAGPLNATASPLVPVPWVAALLAAGAVLVLVGALTPRPLASYPRPTTLRDVATSPVYFGFATAFFGLWAVAFVGVSIQRIVVVAPIFEELLKFGVAILVASTLFDRSRAARIGVALVVGMLFGVVEHATTYPTETDTLYLFRTVFHAMTTVLSVAAYTYFESRGDHRTQWLAPVLSMAIHFFYNTFAVLSAVLAVVVLGNPVENLTMVYGAVAILTLTVLVGLVLRRHPLVRLLYTPLEDVLAHL
jgi:hypothetical protein